MPEEPWLKICHRLPEDPAVIGIADRTGLSQAAVVGQLVRVWIWADQNLVDGNARSVTEKWLDRYTECPGFARAMEAERWLVIEAGAISFPDYEKHMGSSAKKRATATVRVQRHRAKACNAASVTEALPEERRGDKKISPPTPPKKPSPRRDFWTEAQDAMSGPGLNAEPFAKAWQDWIVHLREKRKTPGRSAVKRQIKKCEAMGLTRAVAAIEHSIAGNYQGLYEQKEPSRARAKARPGKWSGR